MFQTAILFQATKYNKGIQMKKKHKIKMEKREELIINY